MSEKKRFILAEDSNGLFSIFDNEDIEDEPLIYGARFGTEKIVDLLNDQQPIINKLKEENEQLRKENERQNNEIKLLRKKITELMDDLEKIPLSIREMWFDE